MLIITGVARLRPLTLMKVDRICVEHNQSNERLDIMIMQLSPPWEFYLLYKYTGNVCMNGHCRQKHHIHTDTYVFLPASAWVGTGSGYGGGGREAHTPD